MNEFEAFPKIARLNRDIVITEKIDGTNAAIGVIDHDPNRSEPGGRDMEVYAQSRSRIITPDNDNFGFARWVDDHRDVLAAELGPGLHFGEWWGAGIQRGYGLYDRRFSLFNVARWADAATGNKDWWPLLGVVPVLYEGPFHSDVIDHALNILEYDGSQAAPGYMKPEGIVIWHTAARTMFKVTLEGDEKPKGSKE